MRPSRDGRVKDAFKKKTPSRCEVCRWRPPKALLALGHAEAVSLLHAHHVYPLACGGLDVEENLILLCPTHHATAHAMGRVRGRSDSRYWEGPRTREHLLFEMRLIKDRAAWTLYVKAGRNFNLHVETELENEQIRANRLFTLVRGGAA